MKTKLILMVLLAFSIQLKAQIAKLGITAGVSTERVRIEDSPQGFTNLVKGDGIIGGEAGLFLNVNILHSLYLRPEAVVHIGSGNVIVYSNDGTAGDGSFTYMKFQVPLIVGLKILGPLSVQGGPVYNYILVSNSSNDDRDIGIKKNGLGYRFGAELGITDNILLGAGFQAENHKATLNDATFNVPYALYANLGIMFGGK
jgi:hypothetical protein